MIRENYWRTYLKENDNLVPVWYNECFHRINIRHLKESEVIPRIHWIYRRNILIFFSPLVVYILFIFGSDYISKKWIKSIILLVVAGGSLSAQSLIYDYNVIIEKNTPIQTSVYIYDPPLQAKYMNIPESNFKYQYPEAFFISYASATSNDWKKSLLLDTTSYKEYPDEIFDIIKKGEGPEFNLVAKLDFNVGDEQFALVKFRLHAPGIADPPVGAYLLQKRAGRWYYRQDNIFSKLTLAFMQIKTEAYKKMIEGTAANGSLEAELVVLYGGEGRISPIDLGDIFWANYQPGSDYEPFPETLLETTNW